MLKLLHTKNLILQVKIFDQSPEGMSQEEFENWLDIGNNAEIVATMTVLEIRGLEL